MSKPPPSPPRRRLSPAQRRQRLLEIGFELFGESAYDQLAVDDIAQRAGISHGLLFHYFGSKRGYYVAVIREAADQLLELSRVALDGLSTEATETPQHVQLEVFLGFVEDNAGLFTLLMKSGIGVDRQVQEIVDTTRQELALRVAPPPQRGTAAAPQASAEALSPLDRLSLTAWIGAIEAAAVEWADLRRRGATTTDRHQLSELLHQMLPPALRPHAQSEEDSP